MRLNESISQEQYFLESQALRTSAQALITIEIPHLKERKYDNTAAPVFLTEEEKNAIAKAKAAAKEAADKATAAVKADAAAKEAVTKSAAATKEMTTTVNESDKTDTEVK